MFRSLKVILVMILFVVLITTISSSEWDLGLTDGLTDYWAMDIVNSSWSGTYNNITEIYDRKIVNDSSEQVSLVAGLISNAINFTSDPGVNTFRGYSTTITTRNLNGTWSNNYWMNGVFVNPLYNIYFQISGLIDDDSNTGISLWVLGNGTLKTDHLSPNCQGNQTLANNTNTMITVTSSGEGGKIAIYKDSVLAIVCNRGTNDWSAMYLHTTDVFYHGKGWQDEIGQWNKTLTQVKITQLYNNGNGITYALPAVDTCSCPGLNNNWEINMSDFCVIQDDCDLGTGTLSFTGSGNATINSSVDTTNLGDPGANGILYIADSCLLTID